MSMNLFRRFVFFGIPEERLGEKLCAAIHLKDSKALNEDELNSFLAERLAKFKIPAFVVFEDNPLPRVGSGKFSKTQLREMFVNYEKDL